MKNIIGLFVVILGLLVMNASPIKAETCYYDGFSMVCDGTDDPGGCDLFYRECLDGCLSLTGPEKFGCTSKCGIDKITCKSKAGPQPTSTTSDDSSK